MSENMSKTLQNRFDQLRDFRHRIASFSHSPDIVERELEDEIERLRLSDPIQAIHVSEAPEIRLAFPRKVSRRRPPAIKAEAHDTGLFLLPYKQAFREAFGARFGELIAPLKSLMERLRDLELCYHDEERSRRMDSGEEKKDAVIGKGKGEEKENPFLSDYRFFKFLYTTIPDNTRLGKIPTEAGSIVSEKQIENGMIVDQLSTEGIRGFIGLELEEALTQQQQLGVSCDNMFVSSIASWASLSTFISIQAKNLEKEMLRESGPKIYREAFVEFKRFIQGIANGFSGSPTAMQEKALFYAYLSLQSFLSKRRHTKDFFRL